LHVHVQPRLAPWDESAFARQACAAQAGIYTQLQRRCRRTRFLGNLQKEIVMAGPSELGGYDVRVASRGGASDDWNEAGRPDPKKPKEKSKAPPAPDLPTNNKKSSEETTGQSKDNAGTKAKTTVSR